MDRIPRSPVRRRIEGTFPMKGVRLSFWTRLLPPVRVIPSGLSPRIAVNHCVSISLEADFFSGAWYCPPRCEPHTSDPRPQVATQASLTVDTLKARNLTIEDLEEFSMYRNDVSKVSSIAGRSPLVFSADHSLPPSAQTVLGIILGGGAGTRLYPLTKKRAKPAVPLGANFRLIDIPVSNCLNSNINKIYCLTQFNSASLNRHLTNAYSSLAGNMSSRGFVEVLAASQTPVNQTWFQGTADAVRQYFWLFEESMREGVQDFLILAGDHLYRMDYSKFVAAHRDSGADVTVSLNTTPCSSPSLSCCRQRILLSARPASADRRPSVRRQAGLLLRPHEDRLDRPHR